MLRPYERGVRIGLEVAGALREDRARFSFEREIRACLLDRLGGGRGAACCAPTSAAFESVRRWWRRLCHFRGGRSGARGRWLGGDRCCPSRRRRGVYRREDGEGYL